MKILKDLINKAEDTLDEIEFYAEKAHVLRADHRHLADGYAKIGEMHITIFGILHDQMISIIEEEKKKGTEVPVAMMAVWEYSHEKLIKEFAEAKYKIEEYKKLNY